MTIAQIYEKFKNDIEKLELGAREFDIIVSEICNLKPFSLWLEPDRDIDDNNIKRITNAIKKRKQKIPLSWIIKKHKFCDIEIVIKDGVFVPRPETEELAVMVLNESLKFKKPYILDWCAGSGAIGLFLAFKNRNAEVFAVDRSKRAYLIMLENKKRLNLSNFYPILSSRIDISNIKFDILVSNPPYIPQTIYNFLDEEVKKEPKSALVSGIDGLDMLRYIAKNVPLVLKKGGLVFLEIGEYYTDKVLEIFSTISDEVFILKDINNKDRYVRFNYNGLFYNRRSK